MELFAEFIKSDFDNVELCPGERFPTTSVIEFKKTIDDYYS